ncbi:MAG: endonuclease/exonuclease/phosphatase family metal-dependent hydrolase [Pseudoalteromonas tetraodonis]|jgi:endonuclease/exonuclease/phosphatase family metal-dependent hydrolase
MTRLIAIFLLLATAVQAQDEITVVGYNLKNYLKMDRRVDGEFKRQADKPEKEIAALIEMIKATSPDVLGLVEIGTEVDLKDLQTRLKATGLDLPHSTWCKGADPYRHVALLSKLPIAATNHQSEMTYVLDQNTMAFGRGILDATIQVNADYQLRILGLHLKSKRKTKEADEALMRRNEAQLLRTYVDQIIAEKPETNLLLFGDFNDTRNEPPIKAVQGKFGTPSYLTDIQLKDKNGMRWTYYWSWADQYSRFDFIFINKGLLPEVDQEKSYIHGAPNWFTASDHRPCVAKIKPVEK